MAGGVAELVRELKTLRKGRALFVRQIGDRVGPVLSQVCGVTADDSSAEVRKKVADRLEGLAAQLPADLGLAVLAAFAIHRDAMHPFYQDRVRWLAAQLIRDQRTARRRIDEGIERLAELAATPGTGRGGAEAGPPRWHIEMLKVALLVNRDAAEALEFRRIVADQDDLDELDLSLTLTVAAGQRRPVSPDSLHVDVIYGGILVPRARESTDRLGFVLELPKRLDRFAKHEFALRYRPQDGQPMQPHYACVLKNRCDLFELRARFDRNRPPRQIWRLTGAFQRDLDDPLQRGDALFLDPAGELCVTFQNPTPGLAYGIRWER